MLQQKAAFFLVQYFEWHEELKDGSMRKTARKGSHLFSKLALFQQRRRFDPALLGKKLTLKMKAYISGDTREGNEKFVNAVKTLWLQGYDCITPADISSLGNTSKNFTIRKRIHTLLDCDAIYMLEGWRKSREARLEHFVALHTGIQIIKEKQQ